MVEFLEAWGGSLREVGLGGFAVYALLNVWKRLLAMSDQHRQDALSSAQAHRDELKERDDRHRQEMREMQEKHQRELADIVSRNMDEHRERNRVQTKMAMAVAHAYARNGGRADDPYPDVDDRGRRDPRDW